MVSILLKIKEGKPLSLWVFDIYFYKKSDLRDRILISSEERGTTSSIPKSRFEYLDDLFKLFDPEYIIDRNQIYNRT